MPTCRQQHISAEESCSGRRQEHISELVRLCVDPQCHTEDVWAGSGQTQGPGEAHGDVVGASLIKPGNTRPPDRAASIDQPLYNLTSRMQRFPAASLAEQEKRSAQSPAHKRRQHHSKAPERVRHVTAPSRAGTSRRRPVSKL
jgi:hypothetical protein